MALCSNKAILIGKAKVKLQMQRISSIALPTVLDLGHSLTLDNSECASAGKNKTGSGRTILETAVSKMAFLPAALLLP